MIFRDRRLCRPPAERSPNDAGRFARLSYPASKRGLASQGCSLVLPAKRARSLPLTAAPLTPEAFRALKTPVIGRARANA
jgi:hypothetical protein